MARFLIFFQVEHLLNGSIEIEAVSREAASDAFYRGDYDDARLGVKLQLEDREDCIVAIQEREALPGFA